MEPVLTISPEVRGALLEGRPVVALETAVLTHGLPRPANLECFRDVEQAVRGCGAVAAPVALLAGTVRVGLSPAEVEHLAGATAAKAGLSDLPALIARRGSGGTTVASTLWAAHRAGIAVFATGGLGGVHRGAAATFDLSGDLGALARFGGCVVCAGPKAVLDVPKTAEVLEALGVSVVGYGTDVLPAFYCRDSGVPLAYRVDAPDEAARLVRARDLLGLTGAVVVVQPAPPESAVPETLFEAAVAGALSRAEALGVRGKAVTPFLLAAVSEATAGRSVTANRALLVANARLAAQIALELAGPEGAS